MLCEAISNLPTYMSLVQWVDIRLRDGNTEKLTCNITLFVVDYVQGTGNEVETTLAGPTSVTNDQVEEALNPVENADTAEYEYDVFISYSHANEDTCKLVVEILEATVPGIRIFVDRQELHTGGSWQQKLYHAVESSHMTIALLSQAYFNSKMCNEEFKLSLARHFTEDDYHLIPLQIEQLSNVEDKYLSVPNSIVGEQGMRCCVEHQLAPAVKDYLSDGKADGSFISLEKDWFNLENQLKHDRSAEIIHLIKEEPTVKVDDAALNKQIVILFSPDIWDSGIALRMKRRLNRKYGLKSYLSTDCTSTAAVLTKLDEADMIVVLVSSHFLEDDDLIEGLQVAINRQRSDKRRVLYPVLLDSLDGWGHSYHLYCKLLQYEICLTDYVWTGAPIDQVMRRHPNYQGLIAECEELQQTLSEVQKTWALNGFKQTDTILHKLESSVRPSDFKCIATVCNRIVYHISQSEFATNPSVLIDFGQMIKRQEQRKSKVKIVKASQSKIPSTPPASILRQQANVMKQIRFKLSADETLDSLSEEETADSIIPQSSPQLVIKPSHSAAQPTRQPAEQQRTSAACQIL